MENKKHIIIFSHGFGVRKDDRGLLSDVANYMPEVESILFDYFIVDEENKTLTTCTIAEQVKKFNIVLENTCKSNPNATIDIIAHSQGTIVVALANPEGIRKSLFLAPVLDLSIERTLKRYESREGADIHFDSISTLPVLDGLVRLVPPEYWVERKTLKPFDLYNNFTNKTELVMIQANQDNILGKVDTSELDSKITLKSIDGDHEFSRENRENLLRVVREIILK